MELLLSVSAFKRASASRVTAVIPYLAYSRQCDLTSGRRRSLFEKEIVSMLSTLGCDRVITVNL